MVLQAVKPGVFSTSQSTQQNLTTTSIPAGPTVPQHLHVHPYSQPTLPLGHFANMIGYPFLPQSYTYMPSAAFQQAYTSNNAYHQPPAAVNTTGLKYTLPQYKTGVAVSSLPQSANVPSGLGGFGSLASIPGSFALNPSTGSVSSTIGYDDLLGSQYKEGSPYVPSQQVKTLRLGFFSVKCKAFIIIAFSLTTYPLYLDTRMKIQRCGCTGVVQGRCPLCQPAHITACRGRTSLVDFDRASSHHLMGLWGTQISTTLKLLLSPRNISKMPAMGDCLVLRDL